MLGDGDIGGLDLIRSTEFGEVEILFVTISREAERVSLAKGQIYGCRNESWP